VVQMLASELLLGSNRVVATGHIDYNFGEWRETGEEWPGPTSRHSLCIRSLS
jgi:hypothetical protein